MDIFTVAALNRVVDGFNPANTYLLRTFFPGLQIEESEEIHFDVKTSSRRLAPFVAPIVQGQIVEKMGYTTNVFKPAYVKDKRVFLPTAPIRRLAGERIGGSLTREQRMAALVNGELIDQQDMLARRFEVMAAEAVTTGAETIVGELYPEKVVSFGRHSSLTINLTGAAEWGDVGVDPVANLSAWQTLVHAQEGVRPNRVTLTNDAWELFKNSASVIAILERFKSTAIVNERPPSGADDGWFAGSIGGFDFHVYGMEYIDPIDNLPHQALPPYTVILGDSRIEGVKAFGAILDHDAGLVARESFTKSWVEKDPSVRYIMMQSAPLMVPYRPNAMLAATVKQ